jgi:hypothetical protein
MLGALVGALAVAFGGAGSAQAAALTEATIAYWPLDEVTGTAASDVAGGHDGTFVNGPELGVPGAPPPDARTAVHFDGTRQHVVVPRADALNPSRPDGTAGAYTVEAWVRPTSYPIAGSDGTDSKAIFCSRDAEGLRGFMLYLDDYVGRAQFAFVVGHGATRRYIVAGPTPALGTWHHVSASFDPARPDGHNLSLFVDGVDVTPAADIDDGGGNTPGPPPAGFFPNATEPSYIGACAGSAGTRLFFPGTIDEVALYNGVLSPDEIRDHALQFISLRPTRPLVFVHGALGSLLEEGGEEVWPNVVETARSGGDDHLLRLAMNAQGEDEPPLVGVAHDLGWDGIIRQTRACVETLPLLPPWVDEARICVRPSTHYQRTIDALRGLGYRTRLRFHEMVADPSVNLFPFAYDWRKDVRASAVNLGTRIDEILALPRFANNGIRQVDVIAHSQGGLVTMATFRTGRVGADEVNRIVTLGTPYLGTPKFLGVLDAQKPCVIEPFGVCILDPETVQEIVQHFPGSLQLLPSKAYYDAVPNYGPNVPLGDLIRPPLQIYDRGATQRFSWLDVRNREQQRFGIGDLIDQAETYHTNADRWSPPVPLLRIAGTNFATPESVHYYYEKRCGGFWPWNRDCTRVLRSKLLWDTGDRTVLRWSAEQRNCGQPFFELPGDIDKSFVTLVRYYEHEQLAQDAGILRTAVEFLRGAPHTESKCPIRQSALAAGTSSEDDLFGTDLTVEGPLAGYVTDTEGRVTGRPDPQLEISVEGIPRSSYADGEGVSQVFTIDDGSLQGSWTVQEAGEAALQVRRYEDGNAATVAAALPFAVSAGARVGLAYAQPTAWANLRATVDDNGDGSVDRTIPFGPPLSGDAAEDVESPTSTITVQKTMGKKCLASATVTVTATDTGGAGVARIEYLLTKNGQRGVYTGALALPPHGEILVRAIDRAGNAEEWKPALLDDRWQLREYVDEFLTPHVNTTGCLDFAGDVDWWGFEVPAGTNQFQLIGLNQDYDLALYDAAGTELAQSERRGKMSEKIRADLAAGRYFLKVTGYAGAWSNTHPYRLNVNTLGGGASSTTTTTTTTSKTDGAAIVDDGGGGACCESAATGPTGWWRLGEAAGSPTAADSVAGLHGSYVGDPALGAAGRTDAAASFDGVDDYVEVPYGASLNGPAFSVEAWADPAAANGDRTLVGSGDAGRGYGLVAGADGGWRLWLGDGARRLALAGGSVVPGRWTHVAGTYDGVVASLYVDGVLVASASVPFAPNTERTLLIGSAAPEEAPAYFAGALDEVTVYDRARTAAEIQDAAGASTALEDPYAGGTVKCCTIGPPPVE